MAANTKLPVKSVLKIRFMKFSFTGQKILHTVSLRGCINICLACRMLHKKLRRISMGKCTTRRTEREEVVIHPYSNLPRSDWLGHSHRRGSERSSTDEFLCDEQGRRRWGKPWGNSGRRLYVPNAGGGGGEYKDVACIPE